MKWKLGQRAARAAVVSAMTASGLMLANAAPAHAASTCCYTVKLQTPDHVGLYWAPYAISWDKDNHPDMSPGDNIGVDCWTTGSDINNLGDVWYHVKYEWGSIGNQSWQDYVYGYYVDYNNLWHKENPSGYFPHC
ncbi:hypothetical protein ACWGLF_36865 [Streptomyces puniciscabiei]